MPLFSLPSLDVIPATTARLVPRPSRSSRSPALVNGFSLPCSRVLPSHSGVTLLIFFFTFSLSPLVSVPGQRFWLLFYCLPYLPSARLFPYQRTDFSSFTPQLHGISSICDPGEVQDREVRERMKSAVKEQKRRRRRDSDDTRFTTNPRPSS